MPDLPRYFRQLEAARNVGLGMTRSQLDALLRLLEAYAEDLASRVPPAALHRGELHAARLAREIIEDMVRDMALATRNGITLTADRVAEIYAEATGRLVAESRPGLSIGTHFQGLGVSAAEAVLSRPELSEAFKTIRRNSVRVVDQIIPRAVLRGVTSDRLAMELRLHVVGADALPANLLLDRRRIGYAAIQELGYEPTRDNLLLVRRMAGNVADKAQLIARTEPMNAQWEAHIQGAADSPVVRAIKWELSSRHPERDVCDLLAETDWYGMGPGMYDPRAVPPRPHPRDLCRQRDVLWEDPADWGRPRGAVPLRALDVSAEIEAAELPPSQERMLARALDVGESRARERAAA